MFGTSDISPRIPRFFPSGRDNRRSSFTVSSNSVLSPVSRQSAHDVKRLVSVPAVSVKHLDTTYQTTTSLASVLPVVSQPDMSLYDESNVLHTPQSILALCDSAASSAAGLAANDTSFNGDGEESISVLEVRTTKQY